MTQTGGGSLSCPVLDSPVKSMDSNDGVQIQTKRLAMFGLFLGDCATE